MKRIIISFVMISIFANASEIAQKLDTYLATSAQLQRFSGTIVIGTKDEVYFNKGYGYANREHDVLNSPQTMFRACSITKMVTATAILLLQEKKLLNVNDTISKYIEFPHADEITIHHLLSHTSGVSSENMPFEMAMQPTSMDKIVDHFKSLPLEFAPGSDYRYSNANYYFLTSIIERVAGISYADFVSENMFKPVGMLNSLFINHDYMIIKNLASPYVFDKENRCVNGHLLYDFNNSGCGALICTAYDLYLFIKALDKGDLLNADSLKMMRTSYSDKESYGYGCVMSTCQNERSVAHGGGLSTGFKTIVLTLMDKEIYIVILGNMFWRQELSFDLISIMLGKSYENPSNVAVTLEDSQYDEYVGTYDYPDFAAIGYTIQKKDGHLLTAENKELICVGIDQFIECDHQADHKVYMFTRNEEGAIAQLRMQYCSGPYFEVRCDKI